MPRSPSAELMVTHYEPRVSETLCLRVANLGLRLDARGSGIRLAAPNHQQRFVVDDAQVCLRLRIRAAPFESCTGWTPLHLSQAWQFWRDDAGCYLLVAAGPDLPLTHISVNGDFSSGEVTGGYALRPRDGQAVYPLLGVDIVLFSNWLAKWGDLILHASGIEREGEGYAFAGAAGAGKSTLAAACAAVPGATLLGEDNVVLRRVEGRFWIFGTPWHLDPAHCSPHGVPLRRLYFLDRTEGPGLWPCSPADGTARLMQTAFVPYYRRDAVARILDNLALLSKSVPFDALGYEMGSDPAPLLVA